MSQKFGQVHNKPCCKCIKHDNIIFVCVDDMCQVNTIELPGARPWPGSERWLGGIYCKCIFPAWHIPMFPSVELVKLVCTASQVPKMNTDVRCWTQPVKCSSLQTAWYNAHNSSAVFDIACNVFLLHCTHWQNSVNIILVTSMFIKSSSDSELRCSSEFDNTWQFLHSQWSNSILQQLNSKLTLVQVPPQQLLTSLQVCKRQVSFCVDDWFRLIESSATVKCCFWAFSCYNNNKASQSSFISLMVYILEFKCSLSDESQNVALTY